MTLCPWRVWWLSVWLCLNPAKATVSVMGSLDRHFVVAPGEAAEGEVWFHNTHDRPVIVTASLADYRQLPDRDQWPAAPSHPRSLAPFIRFAPVEQRVPANTRARVAFKIAWPDPAPGGAAEPSLTGTYWAALMIQPQPLESPEAIEEDRALYIRERFQTAVRLAATLPTPATSELVFAQAQWQRADASSGATGQLDLVLTNAGQRLLDLTLDGEWVALSGVSLARHALGRVQIYPGGHRRVRWPLKHPVKRVREGLVVATPTPRMLSAERFGARFVLDGEASIGP